MEQYQSLKPTPRPPERRVEIAYAPSQLELYRSLPTNCSVSTMVQAKTPTIADIKNNVSLADARALLSVAVCEVCDFFNVGKNMNDTQIAITVDLILESFWYLRLEEIKYCFRRAMRREKVYDRLDGNIIIGWLNNYADERTEEAMRISEQTSAQMQNAAPDPNAVSFDVYLAGLRERAKTDPAAAALLESADNPALLNRTVATDEVKQRKEHEFRMWRLQNYLRGNKQ